MAKGSVYTYTFIDGKTQSTVTNNNDGRSPKALEIWDTTDSKKVEFTFNEVNNSFKFDFEAGHNYELHGGESTGALTSASLKADETDLWIDRTTNTTISAKLDDLTKANLAKATVTSNQLEITVLPSAVHILYPAGDVEEDFSSDLAGWTDHTAGGYKIENKTLIYTNADPATQGTIVTKANMGSDYTIEADVTPGEMITFGLVFRYQGANNNYLFVYAPGTGLHFLKRANNSIEQNVINKDFTMEANKTYYFKAVVSGTSFTLYIDGGKKWRSRTISRSPR